MTLALSDFTNNDTVRGLLGVSEDEIEDQDFDALAAGNLLSVTMALEDVNSGIPDMFETVKNVSVASRTALQTRFYSVVRLFAQYTVADLIANGAVAMFAPVVIQDGKTAMQQRADDPYTPLRTAIKASLVLWRSRLIDVAGRLDASLATTPKTLTLIGAAGLPADPVTGS
jgi:hypothetical protein